MQKVWKRMPQWLRDTVMFLFIMGCAVAVCELLSVCYDDNNPFATSVFILAVVLVSRFTTGYWPGILASAVGVVSVNYLFTYPFHEFNLTIDGYPLTFAVMLVVSVLVSTLTTQIKRQEQLRYEAERDRMRANLLRSVSHDIRTPLTAIMGLSATVEESETLTDEGRGMVEEIHQNAQWLLHLSENILSVTRFCDEGVVIEKSDEVVEEIVGSAIRRFRKNCDTDIPITVSKPEEILLAPMDATLIEQVLPVVLAVDVEQQRAQRAQLRRCDRDAADAAGRLALGRDLAADDELIVVLDLIFLAPVPARVRVERRADDRLFGAGTHELARGARAEDRVHGVHKDGFARARLAGQDVQAGTELQIRPLDDRDVFNMQFSQQSASPPAVSSKQLFDLVEKLIGGRIVLHEQKCRVVARKRADERVDAHTVECGACSRGEARQRLDDDDVLRLGIRRHTFPENFLQALIVAGKFVRRRCGVTVFPARRERLRQVQLLNVARQRRLRARNAALRQHIHELVLRLDLLLCNDLQNDVLSGGFHVVPPHSLSVSLPKAVS